MGIFVVFVLISVMIIAVSVSMANKSSTNVKN